MAVENGLDDIQPQAHTVPVLAARAVGLVKTVKDQGDLLRRDGVAMVTDRHIGLPRPGHHRDAQRSLRVGEFDGVVQQIVAHLGDGVGVAPYLHRVVGKLGVHIQVFAVDLGLQAHQHPQHDLRDIKLLLGGDPLTGLEPAQIQHLPHQPGEPPGLGGDDLQIFLLSLRWDGAIQNTVGKAGNGGHGGLELVGDVGHKLAALGLRLGDGVSHGVEGLRQLPHLVTPAVAVDSGVILPMTKLSHRLGHILERPGHLQRGHRGGDEGNEHDHHRGEEENGGKGPPDLGDAGRFSGHKDHASQHLLSPVVQLEGDAGHIAGVAEGAAQGGHGLKGTGGLDTLDHAGGQLYLGEVGQLSGAAGGIDDLTVLAAQKYSGSRHRHHRVHRRLEAVGKQVEAAQLIVHADFLTEDVGDVSGVVADGVLPLADGIAVGEGDEGRSQHGKGNQDHPGHNEKLSLIEAFQGQGAPFLMWVQAVSGVRTSNL